MEPEDTQDVSVDDAAPADSSADSSVDDDASDHEVLQQVASDFEAQALADAGETSDGDEGESTDSGKGKGTKGSSSDPLDQFVTRNYKGDRDAFLQAQYESRAENKRLKEENEDLRKRVSSTPHTPVTGDRTADVKAARDASPEVQALDQEIKSISSKLNVLAQDQLKLIDQANAANNEINKLTGQLAKAEGDERAEIRAQLAEKKAELTSIGSTFSQNETREETLRDRLSDKKRDLKRAEREVEDEVEERAREAADSKDRAAATREVFAETFDDTVKQYNVDPTSKKGKAFRLSVQDRLASYLEGLGEEARALDSNGIARAVRKIAEGYADAYDISKKTAGRSGQKGAGGQNGQAPGKRPVVIRPGDRTPSSDSSSASSSRAPGGKKLADLMKDPEFVRRRADAIYTAEAKRNARRRGMA